MLRTLLAGLFILFVLAGNTQSKSNFTLSTTGSANLKINFNGLKYSLPDRSTTFQGLNPGNYTLVIYQWQNRNGSGQYEKVYDGNIRLTGGKHLEMTVMRFGKTSWDEAAIESDSWNEYYNNPPVSSSGGDGYYNNTVSIVSSGEFAEIKKAMDAEYSNDNKMRMTKVVLKDRYFSAQQLAELCKTFYSEASKLEFAKYAYDFCQDKGNYFKVAETFYSSTNKTELYDYIGRK